MSNRFVARLISGGRVTIPETIRELLDVKDGDLVEMEVKGKVLVPVKEVA